LATTEKSPSVPTACISPPRRAPWSSAAYAPMAMSSTCAMPLTPRPNPSGFSTAQSSKPLSSFDRTHNSSFECYTTHFSNRVDLGESAGRLPCLLSFLYRLSERRTWPDCRWQKSHPHHEVQSHKLSRG
jgi:hypothetical protein